MQEAFTLYVRVSAYKNYFFMIKSFFIKSFILSTLVLMFWSCKKEISEEVYDSTVNWNLVQDYYKSNLEATIAYLDTLETIDRTTAEAKFIFENCRIVFKKAEPYISYLNPEVGHRVNGPALPVFKEDNAKAIHPIGLQKIEESIFDGNDSDKVYEYELYVTKGLFNALLKQLNKRPINPQRFFVATHQQLARVISHSITGFDTPTSLLGIKETMLTLNSLKEVYELGIASVIKQKNEGLDKSFKQTIDDAIAFISINKDFETFDRYTFLRDYFNPITRHWVDIRKTSDIWEPIDITPFNFEAPTFFENDAFNAKYFTPARSRNASEQQIALGKKLFFDKNLSKAGTLACANCHIPEKGYTDGLKTSIDNRGARQLRNTPTLINTAFQKNYFWDGRADNINNQISLVFSNKEEFDNPLHEFSENILKDSTYIKGFKAIFGRIPTKNIDLIQVISSYVVTLNSFNSKFDRNIRGEASNFTEEEKAGFNLFMGKALCATCHFMPISNGTVPPFYAETEREVIGVPETEENIAVDDDKGFYWVFEKNLHERMFKTPSVRNMSSSAPYMHNGVYETLEQVIDFYNSGGGGGLGFDLPHQTLPFDELNLTDEEQKSLVAFLKTLDDLPEENH